MTEKEAERRHSKALEPELIKDPTLKAEAEAANGLRQYDLAVQAVQTAIERKPFKLRLSLILSLQREALQGISAYAGNFRPGDVEIKHSRHVPPGAHLVPELVEDLCDYVNSHWETSSPVHLAAYVMWRLNWIHPFADALGERGAPICHQAYADLARSASFVPPTDGKDASRPRTSLGSHDDPMPGRKSDLEGALD
ncbi:Fic family protein [Bradyrhizobium sp. URHD0069]|uniref:Fic family protein n=1 Tax=Bradyrhizobium sp. URHD0069 TaxID=1380355 RepID=UPI0009DF488E|nr:Fic family protein [Bradyrhizobium sp. URHD0069]